MFLFVLFVLTDKPVLAFSFNTSGHKGRIRQKCTLTVWDNVSSTFLALDVRASPTGSVMSVRVQLLSKGHIVVLCEIPWGISVNTAYLW